MTADDRDLSLFASCFAKNGSPRAAESLVWQYRANPTGRVFVDFALNGADRLAAIYASLPVYVRIAGSKRLAVQSLDTMTDSDFRGRGLFVKLAKSTFARAAAQGAAFIYGFPNSQSAHGFFERLEWKKLDPIPFLIRPLRTQYVLKRLGFLRAARVVPDVAIRVRTRQRLGKGQTIAPITRFDDTHTELWNRFAQSVGVAVERDALYLNWRLVDKPSERYANVSMLEGDRVTAFVSHCVKDKHEGRVGYVMEAMCDPQSRRSLRTLLRHAVADMHTRRADVALAWCFPHSPTYTSFLAEGFVPFPVKYRPIELHVGVRSFDANVSALVHDRKSWYLSYLDSDTV